MITKFCSDTNTLQDGGKCQYLVKSLEHIEVYNRTKMDKSRMAVMSLSSTSYNDQENDNCTDNGYDSKGYSNEIAVVDTRGETLGCLLVLLFPTEVHL